jgi:serine/threonine protein kinase
MKTSKNKMVTPSTARITLKGINKLEKPACPAFEKTYAKSQQDGLKTLGQGTYGIAFRGCYNTTCSLKQGIKLSTIQTRYIDDDTLPSNIEINIGKELSILVEKNYTPHINKVIDSFRCNIEDLKELKSFKTTKWMLETKELLANKEIQPYVNIYFMELGTIDFHKFLRMRCDKRNIEFDEMLEIIFQIAHTLTVCQYNIPEYRHNDLKTNNLIVKINGHNMDRNFNNYTICNEYNNAGTRFYIPHRGYTVKMIDYDFSNSRKYKNAKIANYKKTNFRYIGYSPKINPVFDLHFVLNSLYYTDKLMLAIPKLKKFIEHIIPKDCIGFQNIYAEKNKLTAYYTTGETNYIPPTMLSPIELIHFTKYFYKLEKQYGLKIYKKYATNFKMISTAIRKRRDMFNMFKR